MNIYCLKGQSQALEEIGFTFSTPERMKLELGLLRVSELANSDQLLFWGKMLTMGQPYYIAVGIDFKNYFAFPHKKFYYSQDNFIFQELPTPCEFNRDNANNFNQALFTGKPETILINVEPPEGEQKKEDPENKEEDSDEEEIVKIVPKNFTELDRLAYTVLAIENQCQLVPVGAFRMIEKHELRYNEAFSGIKPKDLCLKSFQHFRYPQSAEKKDLLESVESVFRFDILDCIENELYWALQTNTTGFVATVRSLLWPGYVAYHMLSSNTYGAIYYGNGVKEVDLPFHI